MEPRRAGICHGLARRSKSVSPKGYIVVIEPDDLIRDLLQRWIIEVGYGVAISTLEGQPGTLRPELVVADISSARSPEATIRALQAAYAAPIIALSARFRRGLGGSVDAAHQLGVRNVLPKPFTRQELLAAIEDATEPS
jgi:AmiR/NasT family two-component response regulator